MGAQCWWGNTMNRETNSGIASNSSAPASWAVPSVSMRRTAALMVSSGRAVVVGDVVLVGDKSADEFGGVGDDRVAEGATSVQPAGNPISHSIHAGVDGPPKIGRA